MTHLGAPPAVASSDEPVHGVRRIHPFKILGIALVAALFIGYPVLVHELIASGRWPGLTVVAGLSPAALVAAVVAFKSKHRALLLLAIALAAMLAWSYRAVLLGSSEWIYLVQNVGSQLFLCWLFGHTLLPGKVALITRLATLARGTLPPELLGYTRRATLAWTLFFATVAAVSLLLFVFAPLAVWSLFANVLVMPLVALMFLAEYMVRRVVHRHLPHVSIVTSVRAYWTDQSGGAHHRR